jgi:hypothetical protein
MSELARHESKGDTIDSPLRPSLTACGLFWGSLLGARECSTTLSFKGLLCGLFDKPHSKNPVPTQYPEAMPKIRCCLVSVSLRP